MKIKTNVRAGGQLGIKTPTLSEFYDYPVT
jgi:hypothetical protein